MAPIIIIHGLPFVKVVVGANGKTITLDHILLDTGSASTIFRTDDMEQIGVIQQLTDEIKFMRGVGGSEPVVEKQIDFIEVGDLHATALTIEIGALDYGFSINGILGMNFLKQANALIDLKTMEIRKG